ncbi:MAG: hypothetical protein M1822_007156 [Bathelium mastoideum]|nr:MAG: hypothetical protein M1822_007156 [Bathelium mastoideum]
MIRRRRPRKPAKSKTAQLEEKLDDLVTLLKAGAQSGPVTTFSHVPVSIGDSVSCGIVQMANSTPPRSGSEKGSVSSSSNGNIHHVPVLTSATDDCLTSSYSAVSSDVHDLGPESSLLEAEEYLTHFQTYKLKYFPIIYLPSTTTAQQLRQERPFLWLCLTAVSSKSISQQQVLGKKIRQTIAQEVVVQSERNIDLLLGLLVFIGWAHYQTTSKPFLSVFTQLAMSLVFDLGLNKPIPKDMQIMPCVKEKYWKPSTSRTMEERRAVLGCFLITSIISSFLQKIDAPRWTPHMDECLHILDERRECFNDEILVHQVRLQLISDRIAQCTLSGGLVKFTEQTREHSSLSLESLQSQLQHFKGNLLSQPNTDRVLFLHLYSAGLETALCPEILHASQLTEQQRKFLSAGLESLKSWFDIFFTIEPAAYFGFPFSICSQLIRCVRCLVTLQQSTTFSGSNWDKNEFWETAELRTILDHVITNLEQVAIPAGLENNDGSEENIFFRAAQMFRSFRVEQEANLGSNDPSTISASQNPNDVPMLHEFNEAFHPDAPLIEVSDSDWLLNFFLSPSF